MHNNDAVYSPDDNAYINQSDIRTPACFTCCTNRDALHPRRRAGYAVLCNQRGVKEVEGAVYGWMRLFTVAEERKAWPPLGIRPALTGS